MAYCSAVQGHGVCFLVPRTEFWNCRHAQAIVLPTRLTHNASLSSASVRFSRGRKCSFRSFCTSQEIVARGFPASVDDEEDSSAEVISDESQEQSSNTSQEPGSQEVKINLDLPRRTLLLAFTCNVCEARTERLVNPNAYKRGTVFVQCAGCKAYHKIVDNLGLVVEYDFRKESLGDQNTVPGSDVQI